MGPPPKPAAVHKLNGNPSRHSDRLVEPPFVKGVPEPPFELPARAKQHWDYAISQMSAVPGMLTMADRDLLTQYCMAWEEFYSASEDIAKNGLIATGKAGPYQNPAVGIRHIATNTIIKLGAKFCLSPSDRTGKTFGDGKPSGGAMERFLGARTQRN